MAIVAVVGDTCTTTTVALASAWPLSSEALIVEADPSGGDLAAWSTFRCSRRCRPW